MVILGNASVNLHHLNYFAPIVVKWVIILIFLHNQMIEIIMIFQNTVKHPSVKHIFAIPDVR